MTVAAPSTLVEADGLSGRHWQDLGIAPGLVVRMVGMRRSGNHAISHWLQRNAPTGEAVFLNNCRPASDPLKSFRGFEISGTQRGADAARRDLPAATNGVGPGALLLVSYEDTVHARFDAKRRLSGPRDADFDRDLLIYRSFLNWSASLLKKMQRNPTLTVSDRMATAVRALATYSDLLAEIEGATAAGRIAICYDLWVSDAAYRAQRLSDLGLPLRDNGLGPVQPYGGGSSFQETAQAAQELQVDARWQAMAQDAEYHALLRVAVQDDLLLQRITRAFPLDAAWLAEFNAYTKASCPDLRTFAGAGTERASAAQTKSAEAHS